MTDSGMDDAINWLWEQYHSQKEKWHAAQKDRMHI